MLQTLIIFVKNPIEGQVKTRVAATVGSKEAVRVYQELLLHTKTIVEEWFEFSIPGIAKNIRVYYGDFINQNDLWTFDKCLQHGHDLGKRMANAFENELSLGAHKVVIIGSDCLEIRKNHIDRAFEALTNQAVVIGPATDGGYYLLGMNQYFDFIFENKSWSQPLLLAETKASLQMHHIGFELIETLSDIDTWDDYCHYFNR